MNKNKKLAIIIISLTIFSIFIYIIINGLRKNITVSIFPDPNLEYYSTYDTFELYFKNLNDSDKEKIEVMSIPKIEFIIQWEENTLKVSPNKFAPDSSYILGIFYDKEFITSFNITTKPIEDLGNSEILYEIVNESSQIEKEYTTFLNENPWAKNFPILKENYNIFYDYDNSLIRIRIKNANKLDNTAIESLKNVSLTELDSLQVPETIKVIFILD